jgi:hypothetical protein
MKKWFGLAALAFTLFLAGCSHPVPPPPPPPPPPEFAEIARQGYRDGWFAARRDVEQGVQPNLEAHPRYRNPPVPPEGVEDYRRGFRRGYGAFLNRGTPPPPPPGY